MHATAKIVVQLAIRDGDFFFFFSEDALDQTDSFWLCLLVGVTGKECLYPWVDLHKAFRCVRDDDG